MAEGICAVEGCDRPAICRTWCGTHYDFWRRHGDPLWDPTPRPKPECSIEGCRRPVRSRAGWCGLHYKRWLRTGSPTGSTRRPWETYFWRKVDKDGPVPEYRPDLGPCWLWTGGTKGKGPKLAYGVFNKNYTLCVAHRAAYELLVGPIPAGLHLDHLCRVPACVNPSHLEPVTPAENIRRGVDARRAARR